MFASIDSRVRHRTRRKLSAETGTRDLINNPIRPSGPFSAKVNRSLVTRRIQSLGAILHLSLLRRDNERAQRAFSILLRCEKHGVNMKTLWELGLEILLRSSGTSKLKAEEFLARVRLTSSDIGRHPTTEKQMVSLFSSLLVLMIRQGKYAEASSDVNNELLNWPYRESPSLRHYASMLSQFILSPNDSLLRTKNNQRPDDDSNQNTVLSL